jgi:hypothetical protein
MNRTPASNDRALLLPLRANPERALWRFGLSR